MAHPDHEADQSRVLDDHVPRLVFVLRLIQLCFFPVFTVVAGNLVILFVPQARDTLLAFNVEIFGPYWWFVAAYLFWALTAWYVSRILVSYRFHPDPVGSTSSHTFDVAVREILPRALGVLAVLPIALMVAWQRELRLFGIGLIAIAVVFLAFVVFRRTLMRKYHERPAADGTDRAKIQALDQESTDFRVATMTRFGKGAVIGGLVLVLAVFTAIAIGGPHEGIARTIGSPAFVLFALGSWALYGGIIFSHLPLLAGWPAFTWGPALLFFLAWPFVDKHEVAVRKLEAGNLTVMKSLKDARRPAVTEAFGTWLAGRDRAVPVIFIATAGGASRAAYWTTTTLGLLEDESRAADHPLSQNVFAISSISGGSLGAAAYVTAVAAMPKREDRKIRALANGFTGRDHLATVVGYLVGPDLFQNFFPIDLVLPTGYLDRSRALEDVWARDWVAALGDAGITGAANPWEQALLKLYTGEKRLPQLLLNTSALSGGNRVLQSYIKMSRTDAVDLFGDREAGGKKKESSFVLSVDNLTLTGAVHNSARFPFVSPPGLVRTQDGHVWDYLGDGGYVEAGGALSLYEMLKELEADGWIRALDPRTGACPTDKGIREGAVCVEDIRILVIANSSTSVPGHWLCGPKGTYNARNAPRAESAELALPEIVGPVRGLYVMRDGRAFEAEYELLQLAGGCAPGAQRRFAEIRLARNSRFEPSLNWMMKKRSRDGMDALAKGDGKDENESEALLRANLNLVRSWLKIPPKEEAR